MASSATHATSGAAHGNAVVAVVVLALAWMLISTALSRSLRSLRERAWPPAPHTTTAPDLSNAAVNTRHRELGGRGTGSRFALNRAKQPAVREQGSTSRGGLLDQGP